MIETARTRYLDAFHFYSNDKFIGQSIRRYGEYTEVEIDLMAHFITADSVVYDVGANIGYHTVALASRAAHVYSFEPNLKNRRILDLNTAGNSKVTIMDMACSNIDGLSLIGDFDTATEANYGKCEVSAAGTFGQTQLCTLRRIDGLDLPPPNLMKIDVEGHELQVMVGAEQTIVKHRPVIFYEAQHVPGQDQIYNFLAGALGYHLFWVPVFNYNPNNFYKNPENIFLNSGMINILAVPAGANVTGLDPVLSAEDTSDLYVDRKYRKSRRQI